MQLADVIAGAGATFWGGYAARRFDDFATALRDETLLPEITGEPVWPTQAVSPAEYGKGRTNARLDMVMAVGEREATRHAKRT